MVKEQLGPRKEEEDKAGRTLRPNGLWMQTWRERTVSSSDRALLRSGNNHVTIQGLWPTLEDECLLNGFA